MNSAQSTLLASPDASGTLDSDSGLVTEDPAKLTALGFEYVHGVWDHKDSLAKGPLIVFGVDRVVLRVCPGGTRFFDPTWRFVRRLLLALKTDI